MFWINRSKNKKATVTSSVVPCLAPLPSDLRRREVVHIIIADVDETIANCVANDVAEDTNEEAQVVDVMMASRFLLLIISLERFNFVADRFSVGIWRFRKARGLQGHYFRRLR